MDTRLQGNGPLFWAPAVLEQISDYMLGSTRRPCLPAFQVGRTETHRFESAAAIQLAFSIANMIRFCCTNNQRSLLRIQLEVQLPKPFQLAPEVVDSV